MTAAKKAKTDPKTEERPPLDRMGELQARLGLMHEATSAFRSAAVAIKCPAFQEFAKMMGEYVGLCREAAAEGIDFEHDPRGSRALPLQPHNLSFLQERMLNIYGASLEDVMNSSRSR